MAIDLNAVPPLGIEGVEVMDKGKERDGVIGYGAVGVGDTKMKVHKAAIARLFETQRPGPRRRGSLRHRPGILATCGFADPTLRVSGTDPGAHNLDLLIVKDCPIPVDWLRPRGPTWP